MLPVHDGFLTLPVEVQREGLELIRQVNERHLHCEDAPTWQKVHLHITEVFAYKFHRKLNKHQKADNTPFVAAVPKKVDPDADKLMGNHIFAGGMELNHEAYQECLTFVRKELQDVFHDPLFVEPILRALQQHILTSSLAKNAELVYLLCQWIRDNTMYLPLGKHLLDAFKKDMTGSSNFAKHVFPFHKIKVLPEALSQEALVQMEAFLAEAAQAHSFSYVQTPPRGDKPTAVMLSIKNGAGGHTAPSQAMEARLKERGWRVETIHYDLDLSLDGDPFDLLGVTFEDGTPMTNTTFTTRWIMQKVNKKVSTIVAAYIEVRRILNPDLFVDNAGGDLLRKRILPLNPQLLITTLAYHWIWRSLAYRVTGAKTLLVASDVFFHQQAYYPWYRQQDLPEDLRQMHFTTMTDDMELLMSMAVHHDKHWSDKSPGTKIDSWIPMASGLQLDSQISVIGAPVHPAFDAVTDSAEIQRLREKWKVPEGAVSVCISRGKLGYTVDLEPALENYRTQENLPQPVVLQVVCGENDIFYKRIIAGEFKDLGPNITVMPHPLRTPKDFAELRAISIIDDIKAGGGSTFEGWYLISKGAKSMLLLTPGPALWWEGSNCDAMEKWGVGVTMKDSTSKIEILKEVMIKGLRPITYRFPDWKIPFDKVVDKLLCMISH